jgi:hypothetical protein
MSLAMSRLGSLVVWPIVVALVAALAACGRGTAADTRPKVALLDIRGGGGGVRDAVQDMLADDYRVMSAGEYAQTARRLRAKKLKNAHVRKVARKLGLEAVVYGTLKRQSGSRQLLQLIVRDGDTGKLVQEFRVPMKRKEMKTSNRRKLRTKLAAVLEVLAPDPDNEPEADAQADERPRVAKRSRRGRSVTKAERERRVAAAEPRSERRSDERRDALSERRSERRDDARDERRPRAVEARDERRPRAVEARDERRPRAVEARDERRPRAVEAPPRRRPPPKPDDDLDDNFVIVDRVDRNGQVIDDEVPDVLK